jgi:protein SCO1/2
LRILRNIILIISLLLFIIFASYFIIQEFFKKNNSLSNIDKEELKKISLINQKNISINAIEILTEPSIIFFGFTNCPDICPLTLSKLSLSLQKIKKDQKISLYFVSLDPKRDTPETLDDYLQSFKDQVVGLTGTENNLRLFTQTLGIKYTKRKTSYGYTIDHSSSSLLISNSKIVDKIFFKDDLDTSINKINSFMKNLNQTSF